MNHTTSLYKRGLLLLSFAFLLFVFHTSTVSAATCTFASTEGTNNFNLNANWSCGHTPIATDTALVPASTSTTMTASSTVGVLNATGTVNAASFNLTVAGFASVAFGGVVTSTSGTLSFSAGATSSGSIGSVSGSMLFASTLQNNGTLNVGSGTATTTDINFGGVGTVNNNTGTLSLSGSFSNAGTYNANSGTLRLTGVADQTLFGGVLYKNIAILKTLGVLDFGAASTTILGTLTVNGGTLGNSGNVTVVGASTLLSGAVSSTGGALIFQGAVSSTAGIYQSAADLYFGSTFQNNGSLYLGSGYATSSGNVTNSAIGTIYGGTGTWDVVGNFSNDGALYAQTGTVRFVGSSAQTVSYSVTAPTNFAFATLVMRNTGGGVSLGTPVSSTSFTLSSGTFNLSGNRFAATSSFSNTGGYIIPNSGTLVFPMTASIFSDSSGTLVSSFTNPGSIYATITDQSRNLSATSTDSFSVTVTGNAASGGDSETLNFVETAVASGIFRNPAALTLKYAGVATPGSGEFELNGTGSASYTYTDAYDGSDTTSTSVTLTFAGATAGTTNNNNGGGGGGSVGSSQSLPPIVTTYQTLVTNLASLGIPVHALVKLPDDGNLNTQEDSAVYYIGTDGKRHAFPNSKVYFTWYADFSQVQVVSLTQLSSIPLGKNVTYKPGVRMVKFTTDPKTYAVDQGGVLRWIASESVATSLYGNAWNTMIDDVSDAFYVNYTFGNNINTTADFSVSGVSTVVYPD